MKTLLQKLSVWCKKNYKYLILVFLVLFGIIWISIREAVIVKQAKTISALNFDITKTSLERDNLELQLKQKEIEYKKVALANDNMKSLLIAKQKELKDLKAKHQKEIDSLLNIPDDTVFVRLQPIYPNYDNSPLQYPFSGSQIRGIYKTAVSYPLLIQEYELQCKNLNICLNLNTGYEKGIANLTDQVSNLKNQVLLCDQQVTDYQKEVNILNKTIKKKKFWGKTWFTTTVIATGIAILK